MTTDQNVYRYLDKMADIGANYLKNIWLLFSLVSHFQVSTRYNVREEAPETSFRLHHSVTHVKEMKYDIRICTR